MARKDKVVATLTRGVEFLFRKNKVDWLKGTRPDRRAGEGRVAGPTAREEVEASSIIIATGSESMPLPGIEIDERRIVSSTGALSLDRVPERLAVIGGGYIGLELGSVWARLGAKVTVIEYLDRIVPTMDRELGTALQRPLTRAGLEFKLGTRSPATAATKRSRWSWTARRRAPDPRRGCCAGGDRPAALDRRARPRSARRCARPAGPHRGRRGFATNVPGIYAIGDVIRGPMLAHKAEEEGLPARAARRAEDAKSITTRSPP